MKNFYVQNELHCDIVLSEKHATQECMKCIILHNYKTCNRYRSLHLPDAFQIQTTFPTLLVFHEGIPIRAHEDH